MASLTVVGLAKGVIPTTVYTVGASTRVIPDWHCQQNSLQYVRAATVTQTKSDSHD